MTSTRISQVIAAKVGATAQLMHFVQVHGASLSQPLGDILTSTSAFDAPHALHHLLLAQLELLEETTRQMRDAERAYLEEQDDDISLRGELAEASIELDHKLRLTREHIRQAEGDNALQIYGLNDAPPRAREALVSYAHNAIELLSAHPYSFTGDLGQVLETRTVAVVLNDLLDPFAKLVDEMNNELNELRHALVRRNEAIDDWIDTYQGVAFTLRGMALLTSQHDLYDQIIAITDKLPELNKH